MKIGVNGFPIGWNQDFQNTWTQIKNDPAQIKHWERLDNHFKYLLTQESQYFPGDVVANLTTGFNPWCGTMPYQANVLNGTNISFDFSSIDTTDVPELFNLIKNGNKIKVEGIDYFIINASVIDVVSSNSGPSGVNNIIDNSIDLLAAGATVSDILYKPATNQYFKIGGIGTNSLWYHTSAGREFSAAGTAYKIVRISFSLSQTLNGTPVSFPSLIIFQPADKIFYYPAGCDNQYGLDSIRANWAPNAIKFGIYYDAMTLDQKRAVNDVYSTLFKVVLYTGNVYGQRVSSGDWDTFHYTWFGIKIWSLVIKDEFPELYNKIINDPVWLSWYPMINEHYFRDMFGGRGLDNMAFGLMGTNYDPSELKDIVQFNKYVSDFTGIDTIPHLTEIVGKLAEGIKAYFVPGMNGTFQWSDNQQLYGVYDYLNFDVLATYGWFANDKYLWKLWQIMQDRAIAGGSRPFSSIISNHSPFDNPYAVRATDQEMNDYYKNRHHNDSALAITFYHSGFTQADTAFMCYNPKNQGTDHNPNGTGMQCYSKNEWCLDEAKSYWSYNHFEGMNTVIPFNAYGILDNYKIQRDYRHGQSWAYLKITKQSVSGTGDVNNEASINGGGGNVLEQTRHVLFFMMKDGSRHIILLDEIETPNDRPGTAPRTTMLGKTYLNVPNNIRNIENCKDDAIQRMEQGRYRHQIAFHCPVQANYDPINHSWNWFGNALSKFGARVYQWDSSTSYNFEPKSDVFVIFNHQAYFLLANNVNSQPDISPSAWRREPNFDGATGPYIIYSKGTQKVSLKTFVNNYSQGIYDLNVVAGDTGNYPCIDLGAKHAVFGGMGAMIRVIPEAEQFGRFHWKHAIHIRDTGASEVSYTETPNGLIIQGSEKIEVSFLNGFNLKVDNVDIVPDFININSDPLPPLDVPPPPPTPHQSSLILAKNIFSPGEQISVNFTNDPSAILDWIGMFPAGPVGPGKWNDWEYLNNSKQAPTVPISHGIVTFNAPINPGNYSLYIFSNDKYDIIQQLDFIISSNPGSESSSSLSSSSSQSSSSSSNSSSSSQSKSSSSNSSSSSSSTSSQSSSSRSSKSSLSSPLSSSSSRSSQSSSSQSSSSKSKKKNLIHRIWDSIKSLFGF